MINAFPHIGLRETGRMTEMRGMYEHHRPRKRSRRRTWCDKHRVLSLPLSLIHACVSVRRKKGNQDVEGAFFSAQTLGMEKERDEKVAGVGLGW